MLNGRRVRFPSRRSFPSTIPLEPKAQTSRKDPAAPPAPPLTHALPAVKTNLPLAYAVEIKLPPRRTHRQDIRFLPTIGPRQCVDIAQIPLSQPTDLAPEKRHDIQRQLPTMRARDTCERESNVRMCLRCGKLG